MGQKAHRWLKYLSAGLLLFSLLLALLPKILNTHTVRSYLVQVVQKQSGLALQYDEIGLSFFPQFGLEIQNLSIQKEETASLRVPSFVILPNPLSYLLEGVASVDAQLVSPQLSLTFIDGKGEGASTSPLTPEDAVRLLEDQLSIIRGAVSNLSLRIVNGRILLDSKGRSEILARGLDATLEFGLTQSKARAKLILETESLRVQQQDHDIELPRMQLNAALEQDASQVQLWINSLRLPENGLFLEGRSKLSTQSPGVDVNLQGRVGDLPFVMNQIVGALDEKVEWRSYIEGVKAGSVPQFSLILQGDKFEAVSVLSGLKLNASLENASFSAPFLALPIRGVAADIRLAGSLLSFENLAGQVGSSSLDKVSANFDFAHDSTFRLAVAKANLDLAELYPRVKDLASSVDIKQWPRRVEGTLQLDQIRLAGPLLNPEVWTFASRGTFKDILLDHSFLPAPLHIAKGRLQLSESEFELANTALRISDAALTASGHIGLSATKLSNFSLQLQGQIGQESAAWLQKKTKIPEDYYLGSPLQIASLELIWSPEDLRVETGIQIDNGPKLSVLLRSSPTGVDIKRLNIKDHNSDVQMSFQQNADSYQGSYQGRLQRETLSRIFPYKGLGNGWIDGDLRFQIPADRKLSSVDGGLQGGDLVVSLPGGREPLEIKRFNLEAKGSVLNVEQTEFRLGTYPFLLSGGLELLSSGKVNLDLDLSTKDISMETFLKKTMGDEGSAAENSSPAKKIEIWNLPLTGEVRVAVDHLKWKQFTLAPLRTSVQFKGDSIVVGVNEAALCGISTTGHLLAAPDESNLTIQIMAENKELTDSFQCFTEDQGVFTGLFTLQSEFHASGPLTSLADKINGAYEVSVSEGDVKNSPVLAKLLEVLNVSEIVRGKLPDISKQSVGYNSIDLKGALHGSLLKFDEFHMDGDTIDLIGSGTIDLTAKKVDAEVLAAPLKTVDSVVKKLPIVNYLLAGSLVTIPVRIQGDMQDPQIRILSATSIGSGVLGLAERVLKLPVKVVDPLLPASQVSPEK